MNKIERKTKTKKQSKIIYNNRKKETKDEKCSDFISFAVTVIFWLFSLLCNAHSS